MYQCGVWGARGQPEKRNGYSHHRQATLSNIFSAYHQIYVTRASLHFPCPPAVPRRRKTRGLSLVTLAGPSTSSYVFAFVFPLSLLTVTIFISLKVDDKLERDFLEEVAVNEAIREAGEQEGDAAIPVEEEPAVPRTRKPKREAWTSSLQLDVECNMYNFDLEIR